MSKKSDVFRFRVERHHVRVLQGGKCISVWDCQCSLLPLCLSLRPATCCPVAFPFGRRPSVQGAGYVWCPIPRVSFTSLRSVHLPWAKFLLPLRGVRCKCIPVRPFFHENRDNAIGVYPCVSFTAKVTTKTTRTTHLDEYAPACIIYCDIVRGVEKCINRKKTP